MDSMYHVKTDNGYLRPQDGIVSYTTTESEAGHFLTVDEAHGAAAGLGYSKGDYWLIPVKAIPNPRRQ